ncbi:MBL fold metallo-hydrolase [Aquimarina intermedia]|uniref:Glyoxylase-like metal-dependent hydrolase (Beta-lactamase superfamily II) n=1 Tax=Aquimarina intermedia TaxID=350814 RepID=A0A5S5C2V7_9FLAO|nr:rhodanese-like domain-containing protein [Aquimarina intermedia]TYP72812.1 glyoxylase-like metal-dependent hydrolase (beta-lactamase superfamily II) [Aquimarina intermedia]
MIIKQFKDKPLAHYSYAVLSDNKLAIIDPARDPLPYYVFAEEHNAKIVAVFETHPHADFISSHLQIHKETGATIFTSKLVDAAYPHETFDDDDTFTMGSVLFKGINTPGHSPDSISIVASSTEDSDEAPALFTGDTLFIGDVGRPDLREKSGKMQAKREELAKQMYHTMQNKYNDLPNETLVYPAHGAGSLCGKNMSSDSSSTLGREREENWAFKKQTEEQFVNHILSDQPFIPSYFGFNVDLNKTGVEHYAKSIHNVATKIGVSTLDTDMIIIDTRDEEVFKKNHLPGSFNIMARNDDDSFETWLGAIVEPEEKFHIVLNSISDSNYILSRVAKIGYENQMKALLTLEPQVSLHSTEPLDLETFKRNPKDYTIVDVRNRSEVSDGKIFEHAYAIPLNTLRDSIDTIPDDKPVVVHCAGGYRSAAGSSIIDDLKNAVKVYDLSDHIKEF